MDRQRMGGRHSRRAAMLCQNRRFGLYLDHRRRQANALEYRDLPDGTHSPSDCADWLRSACGVESRAELDHNDRARAMFMRIIKDYQAWERVERMNDWIAGGKA